MRHSATFSPDTGSSKRAILRLFRQATLVAIGALLQLTCSSVACATTISWSGYNWVVKSGTGMGPGPNNWSEANVSPDQAGGLDMRISNPGGAWQCAEITSTQPFGFGTFQFWVDGPVDQLDKNIVLGLFQYGGADGINEQDIEFSQFGAAQRPHGNFTVYPASPGPRETTQQFSFDLQGKTATTGRYAWQSTGTAFVLLDGFHDDDLGQIHSWSFTPGDYQHLVPQTPMAVHINLWLFRGQPPSNGQPVAIKLKKFSYLPLSH